MFQTWLHDDEDDDDENAENGDRYTAMCQCFFSPRNRIIIIITSHIIKIIIILIILLKLWKQGFIIFKFPWWWCTFSSIFSCSALAVALLFFEFFFLERYQNIWNIFSFFCCCCENLLRYFMYYKSISHLTGMLEFIKFHSTKTFFLFILYCIYTGVFFFFRFHFNLCRITYLFWGFIIPD